MGCEAGSASRSKKRVALLCNNEKILVCVRLEWKLIRIFLKIERRHLLPFTERVQTRQDLGVAVVIQADAADQELFVYLTHHRAGAPSLALCHGRGHLEPRTMTAVHLQKRREAKIWNLPLGRTLTCRLRLSGWVSFPRPLMLSKFPTGGTRDHS